MDRFCKTNTNGSYDVLMKVIYSFGNSLKYFQELNISIYQKNISSVNASPWKFVFLHLVCFIMLNFWMNAFSGRIMLYLVAKRYHKNGSQKCFKTFRQSDWR